MKNMNRSFLLIILVVLISSVAYGGMTIRTSITGSGYGKGNSSSYIVYDIVGADTQETVSGSFIIESGSFHIISALTTNATSTGTTGTGGSSVGGGGSVPKLDCDISIEPNSVILRARDIENMILTNHESFLIIQNYEVSEELIDLVDVLVDGSTLFTEVPSEVGIVLSDTSFSGEKEGVVTIVTDKCKDIEVLVSIDKRNFLVIVYDFFSESFYESEYVISGKEYTFSLNFFFILVVSFACFGFMFFFIDRKKKKPRMLQIILLGLLISLLVRWLLSL